VSELIGRILFKSAKILLSKFGLNIKLGSGAVSYPELEKSEIHFINKVFSKSLTMTSFESLCTLAIICKKLSSIGLEGDFVEAGVWRGGSSIIAKKFLQGDRNFFLFDTYAGMTEPTDYDFRIGTEDSRSTMLKWESEREPNHNNWVFASLNEVKRNFEDFQLLDSKVLFCKGDVRETLLTQKLPYSISLLRLDTDFYDSTLIEMQRLWPLLVSGGVLILDDYGHWDGARRAVDEYFLSINQPDILMLPIAGGGGRLVFKK
jgi:hypothetical protein